jgi:hypothetical protein
VEIRGVASPMPAIDDKKLEELLATCLALAGLPVTTSKVSSAKAGSISMGPVARYELKGESSRSITYLVPNGPRFLVVTLTTPLNNDGKADIHFERSLASMKARD